MQTLRSRSGAWPWERRVAVGAVCSTLSAAEEGGERGHECVHISRRLLQNVPPAVRLEDAAEVIVRRVDELRGVAFQEASQAQPTRCQNAFRAQPRLHLRDEPILHQPALVILVRQEPLELIVLPTVEGPRRTPRGRCTARRGKETSKTQRKRKRKGKRKSESKRKTRKGREETRRTHNRLENRN